MSDPDPEVLEVAREWIQVAEGDLAAARLLLNAGGPAFTVCFHAQQAAEKYLKAVLVMNRARVGKTHDIGELLQLLPAAQRPPLTPEAAAELTRGAVATRYPEAPAPSGEEAERLLRYVDMVRKSVRSALPGELLDP
jgi:HEPN domain-containing protein